MGGMLLIAGRLAAVTVSLPTFLYLFLRNRFHADNLFLLPDLVLCVWLTTAALLPHRHAVPALGFGFAFAAGVIGTAVSSYLTRGAFNVFTALIAALCVAMGLAFAWHRRDRRGTPPRATARAVPAGS
ncbi:Uncharacterised protein [Nocardia otitidiscaviarum]|uniref:Uncharacterized protein n=1 Tax=Nocardia otitidiscaviarum TaxID=1823 RepID=A0A379JGV5_9NOCA|nr:hypothetical protein [Nocardia otitidiscaviarum]SUD47748.1 Uncharacterised protein [Nocardia otitidiscaviarum]